MKRSWRWFALTFLGLLFTVWLGCRLGGELLWFQEVGYLSAYWLRLQTRILVGAIATLVSAFFLLGNLALAQRLKHSQAGKDTERGRGENAESYEFTVLSSELRNPAQNSKLRNSPYLRLREQQTRSKLKISPTETLREQNSKLKTQNSKLPSSLPFPWLLLSTAGLSLLLGLLLVHYGQEVWHLWQLHLNQAGRFPPLPDRFRPEVIWRMGRSLLSASLPLPIPWLGLGLLGLGTIALLVYPVTLLNAIALPFSVALGGILSSHWGRVLQSFHATPFNEVDPLFGRDMGFYVFVLPVWELLEFWLVALVLYGFVAVALIYLLSGDSLSQGRFSGFSRGQWQHLCVLAGGGMLAVAFSYWLSRYELLYSAQGVVYGASYTDVRVNLPAFTGLSWLAVAIALFLFWQAFSGFSTKRQKTKRRSHTATLILLGGYLGVAAIAGSLVPEAVQRLVVLPNELARETPFIQHSIAFTRTGFDLQQIDVQTFNPQDNLTYTDLQTNDLTIRNIRLWDTRPLLQTNRQLQQIRPYYRFLDADIDRYAIRQEPVQKPSTSSSPAAPLEKQQVLISARELDYSAVPDAAQTWVNEHLVYTHGYGFTLTPVNRVAGGGLPDYFVKDIGTGAGKTQSGGLTVSSPAIRASIPIAHPRIYYGELTNTYVMTGTRVQELDYPSGNDNVYNTYAGQGGVKLSPLWRRWLFAVYLKDWQMLLTNNFTPQTKLLFRRNINQRVRAIAPFLTFDRDPYLVVADAGDGDRGDGEDGGTGGHGDTETNQVKSQKSKVKRSSAETLRERNSPHSTPHTPHPKSLTQNSKLKTQNYLYWIVDAYTTSDRYPYSDPSQLPGGAPFNYIRNSVKVVIDADSGAVSFYVADPQDPMIQTWATIFPGLLKPLDEMPSALRSHIRYPNDLFTVQSNRLLTYHMTDPQVFYNREDQWQLPTEIYGSQPQLVEPYYLITKLPTAKTEEFILLLPFTPQQRTNLTAWLAARSDGDNYGKSLLYVFPKEQLVYGTEQIEARINQDPVISQQISLWNRQGSRAAQGNLLVIPVNQSLLYVEPLYLEASQNSLPTLVRVIVSYENRIVMAETLEQALREIFQPQKPVAPAIVRPVQ